MKAEIEKLEKEYKVIELKKLKINFQSYGCKAGLIDPDEVGLKDRSELNIKYHELMSNKINYNLKQQNLKIS